MRLNSLISGCYAAELQHNQLYANRQISRNRLFQRENTDLPARAVEMLYDDDPPNWDLCCQAAL